MISLFASGNMVWPIITLINGTEKGPYLSITTNNASECIGISFETRVPCVANVFIGTDTTYSVDADSDSSAVRLHHFNFTGLQPGTTYHYIVNSSTYTASYMKRDFAFETAPTESSPTFSFGLVGDTRPDLFGYGAMELVMYRMLAHNPDFVVNTGDIVFTTWRTDHWVRFFNMISLNNYAATHPYMISIGNHETTEFGGDGGYLYNQQLYYPDENLYYAYNYSNTCFISLDVFCDSFMNPNTENEGVSNAQLAWLDQVLSAANASDKINWIIVSSHYPAYSSGGNTAPYIQYIMPILNQYDVDLLLWGHDHFYERLDVNGTPCIIAGGGGAETDPFSPNISPYSVINKAVFQYCILEVNNLTLSMKAYDLFGTIFDTFTIQQTNPWRL